MRDASACELNAVGRKLVVEKRQGHLTSSASLPPTRSSASTFAATRESHENSHWSAFSTRSDWDWSSLASRSFSPAPSRPSPRQRAALPKLRPQAPTLRQWNQFSVTGSACSLADRRCSRRGEAVGAIHPLQPLGVDARPASPERGQLPLTAWLQELGVDVDLSDLLVQGRGALKSQRPRLSLAQRARLDRAFVEQLERLGRERNLALEDLTQDLQIFRLKLHDRQARRRLHDIFGARRRRPPAPDFATVLPPEPVAVAPVAPAAVVADEYIPRTPKAVVKPEALVVKPEEPAPGTPSVPVTPITSRKPTPQKPVPEDPERPETPLVVPSEPSSEEEQPLEEPVRLAKTVATPKARPAEQVKLRPEVKEMERPKVQEVVEEEEVRGLFRIKAPKPLEGQAVLLLPPRKPSKVKSKSKSKGSVRVESEQLFQEESEKPTSSQGHSRPISRRRFHLAEQFREALATAWQRALQALEEPSRGGSKERNRERETSLEQEDSSDKEFMKTFTSLFGDVDSTESFSLSESAKQLQRRRYRRRLLRRSCVGAAGCWAGRMEVCRRLLKSVDVLAATC